MINLKLSLIKACIKVIETKQKLKLNVEGNNLFSIGKYEEA